MTATFSEPRELWVIGHRVTLIPAGARVAAVQIVTPPGVPGPPPHHHEDAAEAFFVLDGRLGVMVEGEWTSLGPGGHAEVPRGAVHTFRNDGDEDLRVITCFDPEGFERFFVEFGIDAARPGAFEESIGAESIGRVVEGCHRFGMILAPAAAAAPGS